MSQSVTLRPGMDLSEIINGMAQVGAFRSLPEAELSLDKQGNEILYLHNASTRDKLKRLVTPRAMLEENMAPLMALIRAASVKSGLDPQHESLVQVERKLLSGGKGLEKAMAELHTVAALSAYEKGGNSLF